MKIQWEMRSTICPLFLVASDQGIHGVHWTKQPIEFAPDLKGSTRRIEILKETIFQIEQYFSGQRKVFDVPLVAHGTEFQLKVWEELKKIPYGKTCSYSDIAQRVENKKAVRAVGAANGKNPISILVPCHRVIGANGKLTGFAGGLDIKLKLLRVEKSLL